MIGRPSWHRDVACAEYEVGVFFPSKGEPTGPASGSTFGRIAVRKRLRNDM